MCDHVPAVLEAWFPAQGGIRADTRGAEVLQRDVPFVVEPGVFKVWVGNSSEGGLEASLTVVP
jgi:hypothetical protein